MATNSSSLSCAFYFSSINFQKYNNNPKSCTTNTYKEKNVIFSNQYYIYSDTQLIKNGRHFLIKSYSIPHTAPCPDDVKCRNV